MAQETKLSQHNQSVKMSTKTTEQLTIGYPLANRYHIENVLGVGGMGAVYRARDLHFPNVTKHVAVKEMFIQTHNPIVRNTIVHNFEREANLLATLEHPAIPRIYDYFTHNDHSYLVLEFINGKDLETIIKESETNENQAIIWAIQVCDVLNYLHTHEPEPIIFRDMKPSNIMINQHNLVILIDFGIAKPFEAGQKGTMIGTEGYSPPEQYRGEASPAADVYALGATLHHLLTRQDPRLQPPFSFGERPIRAVNQNVSPELEDIIYKALQYNPDERYSSALIMKADLLNLANQIGVPGTQTLPQTRVQRNGSEIQPVWIFNCMDEIRGTPAFDNNVVFIGSYDKKLYALDSSTGEKIWQYETDGGIVSRPWIDKADIYFGSEDHRLHVVNIRSGRVNWTQFTNGPIRSSPYLAEGHVFIGSDDANMHAINIISGRKTWQMDAGAAIRSTPLVFEDCIFFGTEMGDFYCLDMRGNVKWHFKAKRAITSSPVIANNTIFFTCVDGTLYALDTSNGWVIWRYRLNKASISTPCLADEYIYTGATDGDIYCVGARSAKLIWRYSTNHQVTGSPVIYQDALYCGSVDGKIYCLDYRNGRLRWKFSTEGPITGTPLAIDDRVYIGSTDHKFYALST